MSTEFKEPDYSFMYKGISCTPKEFDLLSNIPVAKAWSSLEVAKYLELERAGSFDKTIKSVEPEYTGGSVSYYSIDINAPINKDADPYTAECQDIINALKLDFNEGSAFKAIWRRAAARQGKQKKGYDSGLYDAEKVAFYGKELVRNTPKESN